MTELPDDGASPASASRQTPGGSALSSALGPLAKTGRYYAGSWRQYLTQGDSDLPLARPSVALAAHALRDEIVLAGMRRGRPLSHGEDYARISAEVEEALTFYDSLGWLDQPAKAFPAPSPLDDVTFHQVRTRGRRYERFVFDSGYRALPGEPGGDRWHGYEGSRRVYGLLLRHEGPRPWLVCVHGAEMGRAALDLTLFRAWHMHHDFGLNVVLPVLPLHGPRARGVPKGKAFPGEDILDNVHFALQAVWDVRRLLTWIRDYDPESRIGLNSISMGGYVTAMVASLEADLTCAILGVPVADLIELLGLHAGLDQDDPRRTTLQSAQALGAMVSPLSLTPRVPLKGRFIYGGIADRVVRPREQVVRLWEHWEKPEIVWYHGGHTGFFGARPVQRFIDAAIVQSGLVSDRDLPETIDRR